VYPVKGSKEYYNILIFKNRKYMESFSKEILNSNVSYKYDAATHSYQSYKLVKGEKIQQPNIGCIIFYEGGFGYGIVSHEIAHAINYLFLRYKIKFDIGGKRDKNWIEKDEAYAMSLGYMVKQFWDKYNKTVGKKKLYERY